MAGFVSLKLCLAAPCSDWKHNLRVLFRDGVAYFFNSNTGYEIEYKSANELLALGGCRESPRQSCPADFRASSLPEGVFVDSELTKQMDCHCNSDWDDLALKRNLQISLNGTEFPTDDGGIGQMVAAGTTEATTRGVDVANAAIDWLWRIVPDIVMMCFLVYVGLCIAIAISSCLEPKSRDNYSNGPRHEVPTRDMYRRENGKTEDV
eukprot:GHVQ01027991.1.p1 GENE.GHVQ01027991.1~~GHVQ01027991.1.p1  ORF type:complete len:207 (+),score=23.64 GHVQ01027991.1:155-775(+)